MRGYKELTRKYMYGTVIIGTSFGECWKSIASACGDLYAATKALHV